MPTRISVGPANQTDAGFASELAAVAPPLARVAFTAPALASGLPAPEAAKCGRLNAPRIRATCRAPTWPFLLSRPGNRTPPAGTHCEQRTARRPRRDHPACAASSSVRAPVSRRRCTWCRAADTFGWDCCHRCSAARWLGDVPSCPTKASRIRLRSNGWRHQECGSQATCHQGRSRGSAVQLSSRHTSGMEAKGGSFTRVPSLVWVRAPWEAALCAWLPNCAPTYLYSATTRFLKT